MLRYLYILFLVLLPMLGVAADSDFPKRPQPPKLVNDFAGMMSADEVGLLEAKLVEFDRTTSTQITIVTIKNLGGYEVAQYAVELGNRWGVGRKGKDNGVLILASRDDHKINISTGYGLEGALTDATSGQIIRNEMVPYFKHGDFHGGFDRGANAIIAATKGEYTADPKDKGKKDGLPAPAIVIIIIVVYFILWLLGKMRGGGGGTYMSGRGHRGWGGGGWYGGGFGGGSGWGGGGSSGGGFGGFGGGSFGGGGASGSW